VLHHPPRTDAFDFIENGVYFVTLRVRGLENRLGSVAESVMTLSPAGRIVEEELLGVPSRHPGVILDAFVVMPNHVHAILAIPENEGKGLPFYSPDPYDPGVEASAEPAVETPASLPEGPRDSGVVTPGAPEGPAPGTMTSDSPSDRDPVGYAPLKYAPAGYSPIDYVPPRYAPVDYAPARYSGVDYKPVDYSPLKYNPMYRSSFETLNAIIETLKKGVVDRLAGPLWQSGFASKLLKSRDELLRYRKAIEENRSGWNEDDHFTP